MSDTKHLTESPPAASPSDSPTVAPTMRLSRGGLIVSLLAMVAAGLGMYALFPESVGGPPLPVNVTIGHRAVEAVGGRGAVLTEAVVIENPTPSPIGRLSIEINGQYLLFQNRPLAAGEVLVLPQEIFTDKRSSHRFRPEKYDVEEIVVTGQLPSGARGVSRFEFAME